MTPRIVTLPVGDDPAQARLYYGKPVLETLKALPEASVHCVVTSPPYWGLRDYGVSPLVWGGQIDCDHQWGKTERGKRADLLPLGESNFASRTGSHENQGSGALDGGRFCTKCDGWLGHLGLEPLPMMFVRHLVEVFREVRRVLRHDGVVWLNLGDSYNNRSKSSHQTDLESKDHQKSWASMISEDRNRMRTTDIGLKEKDLCMIPSRVAIALQEDGWWIRSMMPWIKRNCMPESIADRPSASTEFFFMLTKSDRYFFDMMAIRRPHKDASVNRYEYGLKLKRDPNRMDAQERRYYEGMGNAERVGDFVNAAGRNRRNSDWFFDSIQSILQGEDICLMNDDGDPLAMVVNPRPYPGAHFAAFPPSLVEPCILASTSHIGYCTTCSAPWQRVPTKTSEGRTRNDNGNLGMGYQRETVVYKIAGWEPTCECVQKKPIAATVMDPFSGSGTVGHVALRQGRHYIGIDLNEGYLDLAEARIRQEPPPSKNPQIETDSVLALFGE